MLRIKQWYKNLVIFLIIIFSLQSTNIPILIKTFIGFLCLCLISSTNYIINDIVDKEKDKLNPEKRKRWITLGKIKIWQATLTALILGVISLYIALKLSYVFAIIILTLFILTQIYTFKLKNIIFLDIILISTNFVLRAVSGAFVISNTPYAKISPWLILCTFFLALFLTVSKRESELKNIKEAANHRKVLKYYNQEITNYLTIIATTALIISYSLYVSLGQYKLLLITLPVALFTIFRYYYLTKKGSIISRHPEVVYKDKQLLLGIIIWIIFSVVTIYLS